MRSKLFALLLAATLLAGSTGTSWAGETGDTSARSENGWRDADPDNDGFRRPGRRGHMGRGFGNHRGRGDGRNFGHGPAMTRRGGGPGGRWNGNGMHHGGMFGPAMAERLGLDQAQKDKLLDAMTENYRAVLEAKMELQEAKFKLNELRRSSDAAAEDIVAANEALGAAKGRMEVTMRQSREALESILTPEQKEKLESFRDAPPPRRGWSDGERGERGERGFWHNRGERQGPGFGGPGRNAPPPRR